MNYSKTTELHFCPPICTWNSDLCHPSGVKTQYAQDNTLNGTMTTPLYSPQKPEKYTFLNTNQLVFDINAFSNSWQALKLSTIHHRYFLILYLSQLSLNTYMYRCWNHDYNFQSPILDPSSSNWTLHQLQDTKVRRDNHS